MDRRGMPDSGSCHKKMPLAAEVLEMPAHQEDVWVGQVGHINDLLVIPEKQLPLGLTQRSRNNPLPGHGSQAEGHLPGGTDPRSCRDYVRPACRRGMARSALSGIDDPSQK